MLCQSLLNILRTPAHRIRVDGSFGARTDLRVREFQNAYALKVDGVVGPITWARLLRSAESTNGFEV